MYYNEPLPYLLGKYKYVIWGTILIIDQKRIESEIRNHWLNCSNCLIYNQFD